MGIEDDLSGSLFFATPLDHAHTLASVRANAAFPRAWFEWHRRCSRAEIEVVDSVAVSSLWIAPARSIPSVVLAGLVPSTVLRRAAAGGFGDRPCPYERLVASSTQRVALRLLSQPVRP
eukprot:5061307-Pleurochrysis_carterae.AAC.1